MKLYRKTLQQTSGHWHALSAILLLELLSIPLALLAPVGIKIAIDSVISGKPVPQMIQNIFPAHFMSAPGNVLMLAVALQFLVVLLIQARSFCSYLMKLRCGERMVLGLRSRMFRHLLALPLTFHDNRGSTDSSLRIGDDAGAIRSITIDNSLFLISDIVKLLGVGCVTFFIDWRLALLALSIAPFLVIYAFFYNRWVGDRYKAVRKLESAAQQIIQEVLSSLRIVKAFAQETSEEKRFVTQAQESEAARIQLAFADATFGLVVNLTTGAGMAMVLYMGIRNVQMGIVTLGSLLMVITYLAQLYAPLQNITYHMASFKASSASVERALEIFEARPEESLTQASSEKSASRTTGTIEFHNVTFAHRANLPILEDFNLTVPGGAKIGLVGKTGAGKTTLVNLLVRFLDPHSGHIRLDGRDLREYSLPELRHQFAMVLQEPVLFSTTIAKNIAYGRPEATRVEIIEASILANAHHFIQKLPMGYDTHVGERGILLSGGERQRVSIARAFLKDAPILVLDEPTSSLDIKTESEILDSMERLVSGRTTFLISHRLQALSNCDFVLKLEQGKPPDMLRVHSINELESLLQSPRLRPDEVAVA